ncbi:TAXI family TRAP transporter solute-binding subunit [Falsiroseomonas sp.]|uniref:TAXI family TRAP transporter solute-binding subunit n=1 Tax=Falsiroseomonas sp. TaxID=2870721 RepID=UPI00271B2751|nr:TAXI family TRAP transporter solute-binding subunit [Falsiroseomonas sp.]MDO9499965.1 TAXI family TRAP transporter solute-binding subunit [Falsiroseomonas sp.]MDP3416161.1 TAXI family TRAP transporter solute-binding subunit [Falsiroseomonas sp.]
MNEFTLTRRGLGLAAAAGALAPSLASAQAPQFFRIGTGSAGGTYYPIGGIIANAISCPPGAPCNAAGATDGVPGMVAVAVATQGSVQNVNLIQSGNAEAGFTQSDVAHWSFTGTGLFEGRPKVDRLRFVAHLFPEHIHAVVRRDSAIRGFSDLAGKRIAIGLQASGARIGAEMILEANGLRAGREYTAEFLNQAQGTERMQDRGLDATFTVVGYPAAAFTEFCSRAGCRILPITGAEAQKVIERAPFYGTGTIPRTAYEGLEADIPTLTVGAVLAVRDTVPEETVYAITRALWSDTTRGLLDRGHAKGREIVKEGALTGRGVVPFHPGAERYYREHNILR